MSSLARTSFVLHFLRHNPLYIESSSVREVISKMKTAALALALASTALGQSLTEVLSSNPQLSNLTNLLQPFADQFSNLTNITLLAPDNTAISTFLNTSTGAAVTSQPDLVQAILKYVLAAADLSSEC